MAKGVLIVVDVEFASNVGGRSVNGLDLARQAEQTG